MSDLQRRIEKAVGDELFVIGEEITEEAVVFLTTPQGPHGRVISNDGDLAKSITTEVETDGGVVTASTGPSVRHGLFVHEGTRPHWAPIAPLKYWARKKMQLTDTSEISRVAHAVQRKIAREGTEAKPFLTGPFERKKDSVKPRAARAIDKVLNAG